MSVWFGRTEMVSLKVLTSRALAAILLEEALLSCYLFRSPMKIPQCYSFYYNIVLSQVIVNTNIMSDFSLGCSYYCIGW